MERFELGGEANCLYYVSSKCRSWIPAKTLLIFAPDSAAKSKEALESFAENGGWLETGEEDGAVLVLPLAPRGWAEEDTIRVKTLHKTVWRDTLSPDPSEVFKNIWCWETMIFAVGYEEGAVFAGNAAVCQPSLFACVAMINGVPDDYTGGEALSDRFFLPDASDHWIQKNREIPVPVWFLGQKNTGTAEAYFRRAALCPDQVRSSKGDFCCNTATTKALMAEFATRIRWKNSPDGTPARIKTEQQIRTQGEYISDSVDWNGNSYNFYTRFPSGMEHAKGLPVVICMHGHGEPAWLFAQKNGWPELQDETRDFLFVSPDSPENSWTVARDEGMHLLMLDKLEEKYEIDRTRVYLTGFSNGAMGTCWYGTRNPQLYAALAPWNSPLRSYEDNLLRGGWEMPIFAINGDLDHKMDIPRKGYERLFATLIRTNGGTPRPCSTLPWNWEPDEIWNSENRYLPSEGFTQGDRLTTYVYNNGLGQTRFCFTEVRDMPHGAIADEARATWQFFQRFSRPTGSKAVIELK